MGYVLNKYDQLSKLRKEIEEADKKSIRLTAFIVHDPDDFGFCDYIRNNFLYLSRATGDRFLFFTFIQPNKPWNAIKDKMGVYKSKYMTFDEEYNCSQNVEKEVSPLLRQFFNIKKDRGSYIVLIPNLKMKCPRHIGPLRGHVLIDDENKIKPRLSFYVVKTSAQLISRQMEMITEYCDSDTKLSLSFLVNNLRARYNCTEDDIIDSLCDTIEILCGQDGDGNNDIGSVIERVSAVKERLRRAIEESNLTDELEKRLIGLYETITVSSYFNQRETIFDGNLEQKNIELLDSQSGKYYKSFARLYSFFRQNQTIDDMDYSAFTLYLAKIIENELNLSILQKIRSICNISMPQYYNLYCQSVGPVKIKTSQTRFIDVNERKSSRKDCNELKTLPLGDLLFTYKALQNYDNRTVVKDWKQIPILSIEMVKFWNSFKDYRNNCAHLSEHTEDIFNNSFSIFKNEFMENYLPRLAEIKKQLSKNV